MAEILSSVDSSDFMKTTESYEDDDWEFIPVPVGRLHVYRPRRLFADEEIDSDSETIND